MHIWSWLHLLSEKLGSVHTESLALAVIAKNGYSIHVISIGIAKCSVVPCEWALTPLIDQICAITDWGSVCTWQERCVFYHFSYRHVWTVTLVTIQPNSDDIKILRRCRQVRMVPTFEKSCNCHFPDTLHSVCEENTCNWDIRFSMKINLIL